MLIYHYREFQDNQSIKLSEVTLQQQTPSPPANTEKYKHLINSVPNHAVEMQKCSSIDLNDESGFIQVALCEKTQTCINNKTIDVVGCC